MFSKEEMDAMLAFLDRVNINGKEADTLVYLKNKIRQEVEKLNKPEVVEKKK